MGWLIKTGVGSMVLLLLLLLLLPDYSVGKSRKPRANLTEAISNARQIGFALFEFQSVYGRFPDSATAAEVRRKTGSTLTLGGRTSNDLFAQVMTSGMSESERIFYAPAKSAIRADDIYNTDAAVLEHGECAFAYICGVDPTGDPNTPLAFGPVIPGTKTLDRNSCFGKAAVLKADNSVTSLPIDSFGKITYNGLELLDPRQPFWHGKAPDVKWPK